LRASAGVKEPSDVATPTRGLRQLVSSRGSRVAASLLALAATFLASGPLEHLVANAAGIGEQPYRESAWFTHPAAASAGITGGAIVQIAVTANRRAELHWSDVVDGIVFSSGTVALGPGRVANVRVRLPVVVARTWATITVGHLAAPLRLEVKP